MSIKQMTPSKMSATMTKALADPRVRARMSLGAKRRWAKRGEKARQAARMKAALGKASVRKAMSEGAVRRHSAARAKGE